MRYRTALPLRLALCGLWALAGLAQAQSPTADTSPRLDAEGLVRQVLSSHPGLEALEQALQAAQWRVGPAAALDDPILNYAFAPASIGVAGLDTGQVIGLSQPLPWPGKRRLRRELAEHMASSAEAAWLEAQREAAFQARSLYAQWANLHSAWQTNQAQQQLLQALLSSSQAHYGSGQAAQQSLLEVELRLVQRQQEALHLRAAREAVLGRINALRNRPPSTPLGLPAAWSELPALPPLQHWLDAAQKAAGPVQELQAKLAAAQSRLQLAEREDWPDLRLNAQWLGTMPREENRAQVGIALNLPFGRDKRRDAQSAARAEAQALRHQLAAVQAGIAAELAAAYAEAQAAEDSMSLYLERLLPLAEQSLKAAQAEYVAAQGPLRALIDAEDNLLKARLGLDQARRDAVQSRARLAWFSGQSLPTPLHGDKHE